MSEDVAIRFEHVGKMYKIFGSKLDNLLDVFNLPHFRGDDRYREFWALREIDLDVRRGDRLGIIGRNGAGKSTLLKLVTQNFPPTEGLVDVKGEVQALLEVGGGLHPEFTGNENIRASLSFLGLDGEETERMRREIADFTELGRFLDQPFKTYSQGMQARLAFGIATAVQPEILIVDEILGAGDAYFFMRSVSRMRDLISNGATVLLVSHSLDQVVRFCEETIWIDRGRIVMRGESTEVVKAYEKFIRDQEERRLLARNRKARTEGYDAFDRESYTDEIRIELNGSCEVRELALVRDGSIDDRVAVGDAQDGDASQSALVVLEGNSWSEPLEDGGFSRRVKKGGARALFHLWFFYADSAYSVDITYRGGPATISVDRGGTRIGFAELPATEQFNTQRVGLDTGASSDARAVSRWPGEGSLVITDVQILDEDGRERAVFRPGETMRIAIRAEAREAGIFPVTAAATLYRQDGILISNHTSERLMLEMDAAEAHVLTLVLPALNLGDGRYVFSLALYRRLTPTENSEPYDLLDRSYEFEITGNTPFANGVFSHPALWELEADHMPEAPSR